MTRSTNAGFHLCEGGIPEDSQEDSDRGFPKPGFRSLAGGRRVDDDLPSVRGASYSAVTQAHRYAVVGVRGGWRGASALVVEGQMRRWPHRVARWDATALGQPWPGQNGAADHSPTPGS